MAAAPYVLRSRPTGPYCSRSIGTAAAAAADLPADCLLLACFWTLPLLQSVPVNTK